MVPVQGAKRGDWAQGLGLTDATKQKVDVLYHVGCLTSYDKDMQKLAKATASDPAEGRRELRHRRRRRDLLRRPGLRDGLRGRLPGPGREEHGGHQAVGRQDPGDQLRHLLPVLRRALRPLRSQGRPRSAAHEPDASTELIAEGKLKPEQRATTSTSPITTPATWAGSGSPGSTGKGTKVPGDRFVFDPPKPYRRGTNGVYEPPRDGARQPARRDPHRDGPDQGVRLVRRLLRRRHRLQSRVRRMDGHGEARGSCRPPAPRPSCPPRPGARSSSPTSSRRAAAASRSTTSSNWSTRPSRKEVGTSWL